MGLSQQLAYGRFGSAALLVLSLALVFAVAALGGLATSSGLRDWYDNLDRAGSTAPGRGCRTSRAGPRRSRARRAPRPRTRAPARVRAAPRSR
ncbi:MAG: hypothetical protein R6W48_06470, partial [Gaiellaceae bacterium]